MKPKFFKLRSKAEADEFLEYAIADGDEQAENMFMPDFLGGQTVKLEMRLGPKESRRYIVSYTHPETNEFKFYTAHPAWISSKRYYLTEAEKDIYYS